MTDISVNGLKCPLPWSHSAQDKRKQKQRPSSRLVRNSQSYNVTVKRATTSLLGFLAVVKKKPDN